MTPPQPAIGQVACFRPFATIACVLLQRAMLAFIGCGRYSKWFSAKARALSQRDFQVAGALMALPLDLALAIPGLCAFALPRPRKSMRPFGQSA